MSDPAAPWILLPLSTRCTGGSTVRCVPRGMTPVRPRTGLRRRVLRQGRARGDTRVVATRLTLALWDLALLSTVQAHATEMQPHPKSLPGRSSLAAFKHARGLAEG